MSYDIYLEARCTHCSSVTFGFQYNITHNTNGIVDACIGPDLVETDGRGRSAWGRLDGHTALETRDALARAYAKVLAWSPEFEAQLPANGWGTRESVTGALRWAHDAAVAAPDAATWRASG